MRGAAARKGAAPSDPVCVSVISRSARRGRKGQLGGRAEARSSATVSLRATQADWSGSSYPAACMK
ncbi:hypothetical protein BCR35DRAFT_309031 [Leucosporidium creatinivorum]|uniref:Uncharacterized protein n=1 Tax=Leucosporidium creatinivorum TaxID=106004 RepID=A0A1Y2DRN1_9BASI|nr:hypothetical protein BCR35DRAFT_309031 [Leucosporidium creatinivorum]